MQVAASLNRKWDNLGIVATSDHEFYFINPRLVIMLSVSIVSVGALRFVSNIWTPTNAGRSSQKTPITK